MGCEVTTNTVHKFCVEIFTSHTPPDQWITNVIVPLPKKGDLSLMTNHRGIPWCQLLQRCTRRYWIAQNRDHVHPILRKNQAGFRPGKLCTADSHPTKDHRSLWKLPTSTYHHSYRFQKGIRLKKGIRFHQQECHILSSASLVVYCTLKTRFSRDTDL